MVQKAIHKLELWGVTYGMSSETFDFSYVCILNSKVVPFGRFAYWVLGLFIADRYYRDFGHGHQNRGEMIRSIQQLGGDL